MQAQKVARPSGTIEFMDGSRLDFLDLWVVAEGSRHPSVYERWASEVVAEFENTTRRVPLDKLKQMEVQEGVVRQDASQGDYVIPAQVEITTTTGLTITQEATLYFY